MSKLNQAVLIQLAGIIWLLGIPRPYRLLGWLLILAGGILYRVELKRQKAAKAAAPTADAHDSQRSP
jgi:hypothetical protein